MKEKTMDTAARGKGKTSTVPFSESTNSIRVSKVLFSPKGGISKELVRLTQAAAQEISVAAYAFSSKYLGNALVKAIKRGVKVRLILDMENAWKSYSIDEWLIENGIDVRFIKLKRGCMHHKILIVDRIHLMTGSYNFTNDSEFRNHEAAIFTDDGNLIASFFAEFERLWSLAVPFTVYGGKG
jgi:phosphatidylserine/phosphatidylglycerophosphate/cardiolipin synthase-like enzyme